MDFIRELLNHDDESLDEGAKRVFKRTDQNIVRYFRCTTGPKKGKLVSDPSQCGVRKDPKKVRHGRKVARTKKAVRMRKTKIAKNTALSKMVKRLNKRLETV